MVAIGGIADIVQHWHEMARSRMTHSRSGVCIAAQSRMARRSSVNAAVRPYAAPTIMLTKGPAYIFIVIVFRTKTVFTHDSRGHNPRMFVEFMS